ncbi:MAG: helix-turn-helix domain-containing protein [Xanthobacteraceae bacterium]
MTARRSRVLVLTGDGPDVEYWLPLLLRARDLARAESDPMLTTFEGAELCGRSQETIRRWCDEGWLAAEYDAVDRQWKFKKSELVGLLVKRFGRSRLPAALQNVG